MSNSLHLSHKTPHPDPEVVPEQPRRQFTAQYKATILAECDAATQPGQIGEILRREGLYSSLIAKWRQARTSGLVAKKAGRPPKSDEQRQAEAELERVRKHNAVLTEKLRCAEIIIEAQKKLSEALGQLHHETTKSSE